MLQQGEAPPRVADREYGKADERQEPGHERQPQGVSREADLGLP